MIAAEISMYKPDLMCLQGKAERGGINIDILFAHIYDIEVDQYDTFYKPLLEKLGYGKRYFGNCLLMLMDYIVSIHPVTRLNISLIPKRSMVRWIGLDMVVEKMLYIY